MTSTLRRNDSQTRCGAHLLRLGLPIALVFAAGCGANDTVGVDSPPTVTIDEPAAGETSAMGVDLTLSATASDDEDGIISASVAWTSSIDGALGTGGSVDVMLTVGSHTITASVTDSNGQTATDEVTHEIISNMAPTLSITAPTDGSDIVGILPVEFTGSASDPDEGDLGASISWSSDIDGSLGTGATVSAGLSSGTHTITATVSDMWGADATDDITIDVTIPTRYAVTLATGVNSALYIVEMGAGGEDTLIGPIQTSGGTGSILTDIAESPSGALFGSTYTKLYSVAPATGIITEVGDFGLGGVVGLTFDAAGTLYGSTETGSLVTINTSTGAATVVGPFGGGLDADGDLAFSGAGQLWGSMRQSGASVMATIDHTTGAATVVGPTGQPHIWGLRFEGSLLIGFATNTALANSIIAIDQSDASTTLIRSLGIVVGGAGVSPRSGG